VTRPTRASSTDACPGALRLHAAADGPLARVRLPGGMLTGAQLTTLAGIAAEWGDGGLELTSRANVQLRALNRTDPARLAARLFAAGLLPSQTHETVRNIAAPALATPALRALVVALDHALCADPALAALPGRFLFAIGRVSPTADVAAVPAPESPAGVRAILLAGQDEGLRVPAGRVVEALLAAAHAFLAERAGTGTAPAWRLAELPDGPRRVATRVAAALGLPLGGVTTATALPDAGPDAPLVGVVEQGDGLVAVGAMAPLGRLTGVPATVLTRGGRRVGHRAGRRRVAGRGRFAVGRGDRLCRTTGVRQVAGRCARGCAGRDEVHRRAAGALGRVRARLRVAVGSACAGRGHRGWLCRHRGRRRDRAGRRRPAPHRA
jgi:precorrin-3B synthase